MSNGLPQSRPMINRIKPDHGAKRERLITTFGRAKLVHLTETSITLRGGLAQDQTAAKEWISLFMHEAVLRS
jgi:hypothetical protein